MPQTTSLQEFYPILTAGPKAQMNQSLLAATLAVPSTIAASGSYTSPVIPSDGFYDFSLAVTLSNAGTLTLLRYIDSAGTVALDTGQSQSLTAGTSGVLIVVDGHPCASFQVKITNSGASTATVSGFAALASAH